MKSLAIWHDGSQAEEKVQIDCHLNFWKLPNGRNSFERFLDIGLKVSDLTSFAKIFIYIPFSATSSEVYDLGQCICESNPDLLNAIFNEKYSITSNSTSDYHQVQDELTEEIIFNLYTLDDRNFLLTEHYHGGTLITIKMPTESIRKDKTYLRFRVKSPALKDFSTIEESPMSLLSEAFTKLEIFDFRINSLRHLPNKIIEEITDKEFFNIRKLHFFYICSYKENYILSNSPFIGARQLEKGLWDSYISTDQNSVDYEKDIAFIAYQWTESSEEEHQMKQFNAFIKTEYRHYNWATIFKYLIFISLFSVFIGVGTNICYDLLKNIIDKPVESIEVDVNSLKDASK